MLSLKGDLNKETKDTTILKNYEFEEYWELSICQVTKLQQLFDEDGSSAPQK